MTWLLVGLGGGGGAMLRYWVGRSFVSRSDSVFPYATLIVNLTGCFLIGLILGWLIERDLMTSPWRAFLVIGLLGGYTTFSSFAFETVSLIENRNYTQAAIYVLLSNIAGLGACAIGLAIARRIAL